MFFGFIGKSSPKVEEFFAKAKTIFPDKTFSNSISKVAATKQCILESPEGYSDVYDIVDVGRLQKQESCCIVNDVNDSVNLLNLKEGDIFVVDLRNTMGVLFFFTGFSFESGESAVNKLVADIGKYVYLTFKDEETLAIQIPANQTWQFSPTDDPEYSKGIEVRKFKIEAKMVDDDEDNSEEDFGMGGDWWKNT